MTASLIVVAVGAVAAAAGTAGLTARFSRAPGPFLLAWTVAVFGLAVALAAQTLGYLAGYSDLIFRAEELAAQAVAPLFICLGLVELVGRSVVTRFAMRLAVAAVGVIVLVVLGSDPLYPSVKFSTAWPDPAVVYQLVPVGLIEFLAAFAVIIAVLAGLAVLVRSGRGRGFAEVVRPGLLASGAAVAAALPGVAMLAGTTLGSTGFALAGVLAAGLTWFAATTAARQDLAGDRRPGEAGRRVPGDDAGRVEPHGPARDGFGGYDADGNYPASGRLDDAGYDRPARGRAGGDTGRNPRDLDSDIGYPALAARAAGRLPAGPVRSRSPPFRPPRPWRIRPWRLRPWPRSGPGPPGGLRGGARDVPAARRDRGRPARRSRPAAEPVRPDHDLHAARGAARRVRPDDRAGRRAGAGQGARHARLHRARRADGADAADTVRGLPGPAGLRRASRAALHDQVPGRAQAHGAGDQRHRARPAAGKGVPAGVVLRDLRHPERVGPRPHRRHPVGAGRADRPRRPGRRARAGAARGGQRAVRPARPGRQTVRGRRLGRGAWRGPVPVTAAPTITLLSRPGCHLCDEARAVIERVAADLGLRWTERDITESQDDLRDCGEMIPVTLIDGVQHDFWRVDERRLRHALAR